MSPAGVCLCQWSTQGLFIISLLRRSMQDAEMQKGGDEEILMSGGGMACDRSDGRTPYCSSKGSSRRYLP